MIDKHTRDLYKQSLEEKWDLPIEDIEIFDLCPFCRDFKGKVYLCDIDGKDCGDKCLIDKTICGSPDSLMSKLSDIISDKSYRDWENYGERYLTEEGYADKKIIVIFEKIRSLMAEHSKKKLFSKLRAKL